MVLKTTQNTFPCGPQYTIGLFIMLVIPIHHGEEIVQDLQENGSLRNTD